MTVEYLFTPAVLGPLIATAIAGFFSVNLWFIGWLIRSFDKLKEEIQENSTISSSRISEIIEKAQQRHEENLYRFEKISVALARLGAQNGTYDKEIATA